MKEKLLIIFALLIYNSAFSQSTLFQEINIQESRLSDEEMKIYNQYKADPSVVDISIIQLETKQLRSNSEINIDHKAYSMDATLLEKDYRGTSNYSWLGRMSDETGIFFTVMGERVFSKFYLGDIPYTILPLSNTGKHLLLGFDNASINELQCAHDDSAKGSHFENTKPNNDKENTYNSNNNKVDDNCHLRVLVVFTDDADDDMNMQIIGQGMIDETNLGYVMSDMVFRMELARTISVEYTELDTRSNVPTYAVASNPTEDDLINIRDGINGFEDMPALRDAYQADVVVLVKSEGLSGSNTFYGEAYGIPTGTFDPIPENAFAIVGNSTLTTLVGGRYTFAHEVGHVQGGRHSNSPTITAPSYARGAIFGTGTTDNRTIIANGCGGSAATGCRVNHFSNPDVDFAGTPTGTADRDNARRLDETSVIMRNHRVTLDNMTVSNETFENEIVANHVANQSIITSGNVDAENGTIATMRAGNVVCLETGFEAHSGSVFEAFIAGCDFVAGKMDNVSKNLEESFEATLTVFPNPVTEFTKIEFALEQEAQVSIDIVNSTGKTVRILLDAETRAKGIHFIDINTLDLPNGMYTCRMVTKDEILSQKIIIAK